MIYREFQVQISAEKYRFARLLSKYNCLLGQIFQHCIMYLCSQWQTKCIFNKNSMYIQCDTKVLNLESCCYQLCLKVNCRPKLKWHCIQIRKLKNASQFPSLSHFLMEGFFQRTRCLYAIYMHGFLKAARCTEDKKTYSTQRWPV